MGRREKWYSKIKKVLNPVSKPRRINANANSKVVKPSSDKSESKTSGNQSHPSQIIPPVESVVESVPVSDHLQSEDVGVTEMQIPQLSETAAALVPKIASGIMKHIPVILSHPVRKSTLEDTAATQIQTAYRGYLARRTLRALKGLVRLKFLIQGQSVKRQAANTLQCMQALARVQSQVRSRKLHISKENRDLQKQQMLKNSKKHTPFRNSDEWKDCAQSKQRDEEKMKMKHEAALRRERTLAYSSVHQQTWKSSPKRPSNMSVTDPDNPNWGWSWLERWMAGMPSEELHSMSDISELETTQSLHKPTQTIKISTKPPPSPSLKITSIGENNNKQLIITRTRYSSEKNRRHSFTGSPTREYEISVDSNSHKRSHTMPVKLVNTKPRLQSPLGFEHNVTPRKSSSARQSDKSMSQLVPVHSSPRRHSAPPKVKNTSIAAEIS